MKINKDLMDALMMLSIISLVLISTSDFQDPTWKNIFMIITGIIVIGSVAGRVVGAKSENHKEE